MTRPTSATGKLFAFFCFFRPDFSVVARYVPKPFPKKNVEVIGNLGNLCHCGWDRWMVDAGNEDINVIGN